MLPEITLRLAICANGCPVGPRLERGTPLPTYRHTYALEERSEAEADMDRIKAYVERHAQETKRKGSR
jgi:hypothetical protein